MNRSGARRSWVALALQLGAAAALMLALLGAAWLDPRSQAAWLVLLDRSDSMPRADADRALGAVRQAAAAAGTGELQLIEFAGRVDGDAARREPWATDIEAALHAALEVHARRPMDGMVVVSDAHENVGDAARALRAIRQAGLPLQWMPVARPEPPVRLAEVRAPPQATSGKRVQFHVQLAGQVDRPLRVKASLRASDGTQSVAYGSADATGRASLEFDPDRPGPWRVDLALEDPASGQTLERWADAAVVDVAPRAPMLYAQGSSDFLARSLARGGWALDRVPAARLDGLADALPAYRAVVLDDVAIDDAGPRFWSALAEAVRGRGLGLLVLGGERSFARGGYRDSTLESLLPVRAEPPALGQPTAVVFAVDKSGSMGEGSAGVDRFQLAQRAVLETARGLGAGDALGLLVFDVAPRVLIPLGPAAAALPTLERDWAVSPHGGTRLAPVLLAAIDELERAGSARRVLVLVTDGFVDDAAVPELRARLARARIETLALAVGPDADVAALQRLVDGSGAGRVQRVGQAAELPLAMRSGLERRRARIERGSIAVTQGEALPFPPATLQDWPPIAAYAVTRARPEGRVAVRSERGDPLIAFQAAGRGRVAVVTSGFGPWTPQWLSWRDWPRLAGGLADWSLGSTAGPMSVSDLRVGLRIEVDQAFAGSLSGAEALSVTVNTPTTQSLVLPMDPVAPGRWRATLPDAGPGLYGFVLADASGIRQHWHLRRQRGETGTWGVNPALMAWQAEGLVAAWDPRQFGRRREGLQAGRPPDRSLLVLGLLLFLAGIVVDRARWPALRRRPRALSAQMLPASRKDRAQAPR